VPGGEFQTLVRGSFGIAEVQLRLEFSLLICCKKADVGVRNQTA
jgi:hypothetical protein